MKEVESNLFLLIWTLYIPKHLSEMKASKSMSWGMGFNFDESYRDSLGSDKKKEENK